jgi:DNA-binding transcriptional MerR regulator
MAQDFHAAFKVNGDDDTHINVGDETGVALAAIQGLNEKVESGKRKAETQMEQLAAENADLKARLEKLEQLIADKLGGAK